MVGFPKDSYYYYKSAWVKMTDEIVLYILPNTWNGDTGTDPIAVRVYTNCPFINLYINNVSVSSGKQLVEPLTYYAQNVKFERGEIRAECIGETAAVLKTTSLQTTGIVLRLCVMIRKIFT